MSLPAAKGLVSTGRHERWRPGIFGVAIIWESGGWFYTKGVWRRVEYPAHPSPTWYQGYPLPPPQPERASDG